MAHLWDGRMRQRGGVSTDLREIQQVFGPAAGRPRPEWLKEYVSAQGLASWGSGGGGGGLSATEKVSRCTIRGLPVEWGDRD